MSRMKLVWDQRPKTVNSQKSEDLNDEWSYTRWLWMKCNTVWNELGIIDYCEAFGRSEYGTMIFLSCFTGDDRSDGNIRNGGLFLMTTIWAFQCHCARVQQRARVAIPFFSSSSQYLDSLLFVSKAKIRLRHLSFFWTILTKRYRLFQNPYCLVAYTRLYRIR